MALNLRILYRGPLSSCNYDCSYCPFAKRRESAEELCRDREALERFTDWVAAQADLRLSILCTPWGEALVRRWYQRAIVRLSHLPQVAKVAIQTNLSCPLDWLDEAGRATTALWCTYHPSQTSRAAFLGQCQSLARQDIRFSVGMVGLHESFDEIDALRKELPPEVYLWINAYKDVPDYYTPEQVARLEQVDPLFRINNRRHPSLGKSCEAGWTSVTVDGAGNIRRCHFVGDVIGNLYERNWQAALQTRTCPNATCGCYIGYAFLPDLRQDELFGSGLLERVPDLPHWTEPHRRQAMQQAASLAAEAGS